MMTPFAQGLIAQLRESSSYRLMAIVEMARLPEEERQKLRDQFPDSTHPLLSQDCFANIRDIGPWLFSSGPNADLQSQYDFHCRLTELAGDALCGWLVSAMAFATLAGHLSQAAIAQAPDGSAYMLRFHTEKALSILHARRDLPGIAQLLGPIRAWWVVEPHPAQKAWRQFLGDGRPQDYGAPQIRLDQACWDALTGDPLSYQLAEQLREPLAARVGPEDCHGTRLGRVSTLLAEARGHGLNDPADLSDYVTLIAQHGDRLRGASAWLAALDDARDGSKPLAVALKARAFSNLD
ncbi:DUF4123 domain-containing protein [Achromobacter arsenitoxydans]|uniref:DUF4123 domain-containing protein n=1 Tax=Achromobacter arsenitoxydans SY8 TaxID=477184 RepID=H0FFV5_9BURK|nr:DUF4123 domain-containing protein [Achromobacter arsenitoxydans]EHK62837.1 hypothetical protein KYC_28377 [Achromobacter arsenitoxydans SY8]